MTRSAATAVRQGWASHGTEIENGLNLTYFLFGFPLRLAMQAYVQISQTAFLHYSTFLSLLDTGEVSSVTVSETQSRAT